MGWDGSDYGSILHNSMEAMIFHKLLPLMVVPLEDWYNDVTIFSVRTSLRKCAFPLRPRRNQTLVQFPTIYSPFNQSRERGWMIIPKIQYK